MSQSYGFSSGHVWMRELDYKESWALKNWCFGTVVLEKTFESPLDCKEIKPLDPKGNQSWMFIGRTDVEAEAPILWPPDAKNWLIGKDPNVGKDWRREEKGTTEDGMVGWHHRLDAYEQALGVGDGQGSLACCSPWGLKESDTPEQLNWTDTRELQFGADEGKLPEGTQGDLCNICWGNIIETEAVAWSVNLILPFTFQKSTWRSNRTRCQIPGEGSWLRDTGLINA